MQDLPLLVAIYADRRVRFAPPPTEGSQATDAALVAAWKADGHSPEKIARMLRKAQ